MFVSIDRYNSMDSKFAHNKHPVYLTTYDKQESTRKSGLPLNFGKVV